MQTKLVTLSGRNSAALGQPKFQFSLFSMAGKADFLKVDPRELNDIDAGIWMLALIDHYYPGITWGEIYEATRGAQLGKSWLGRQIASIGDFIGTGISDAGDKIGEWTGDTIRLITDKEVRDGIKEYATAYATGGQSVALDQVVSQLAAGDIPIGDMLSRIGKNTKTNYASMGAQLIEGVDNKFLLIGGAGFLFLILLLR